MTVLRRFNGGGIARFAEALDQIRLGESPDVNSLLASEELTEMISEEVVLEVRPFGNRLDAATFFDGLFSPLADELVGVEHDQGLWAWLGAVWLDTLAPLVDGRRRIGAAARWIPVIDDYRKYYRHLLAGPYRIYRAHRHDPAVAMAVLATPVESPGEVVEQFASRQDIVSNSAILEAITLLYYDEESGALKRGAARKGAGGARRLADVLLQFELTWDIYAMAPAALLGLLPAEFSEFMPPTLG